MCATTNTGNLQDILQLVREKCITHEYVVNAFRYLVVLCGTGCLLASAYLCMVLHMFVTFDTNSLHLMFVTFDSNSLHYYYLPIKWLIHKQKISSLIHLMCEIVEELLHILLTISIVISHFLVSQKEC